MKKYIIMSIMSLTLMTSMHARYIDLINSTGQDLEVKAYDTEDRALVGQLPSDQWLGKIDPNVIKKVKVMYKDGWKWYEIPEEYFYHALTTNVIVNIKAGWTGLDFSEITKERQSDVPEIYGEPIDIKTFKLKEFEEAS